MGASYDFEGKPGKPKPYPEKENPPIAFPPSNQSHSSQGTVPFIHYHHHFQGWSQNSPYPYNPQYGYNGNSFSQGVPTAPPSSREPDQPALESKPPRLRPGNKFSAKYRAQPGDEMGDYVNPRVMSNMEQQVLFWETGDRKQNVSVEQVGGRKFYRYLREGGDWPWVLVQWNLCQIAEMLGLEGCIKGTGSHGRYEWGRILENTINIADVIDRRS